MGPWDHRDASRGSWSRSSGYAKVGLEEDCGGARGSLRLSRAEPVWTSGDHCEQGLQGLSGPCASRLSPHTVGVIAVRLSACSLEGAGVLRVKCIGSTSCVVLLSLFVACGDRSGLFSVRILPATRDASSRFGDGSDASAEDASGGSSGSPGTIGFNTSSGDSGAQGPNPPADAEPPPVDDGPSHTDGGTGGHDPSSCTSARVCQTGEICCGVNGMPPQCQSRSVPCPYLIMWEGPLELCASTSECVGGFDVTCNPSNMFNLNFCGVRFPNDTDAGQQARSAACLSRPCRTSADCCASQSCFQAGADGTPGECSCDVGLVECRDGCFDTTSDSQHCGSCEACPVGDVCSLGLCVPHP